MNYYYSVDSDELQKMQIFTEENECGSSGFLTEVCKEWEAATLPASNK
jgi:NAD dependent epimerase/dehydratase family enzyme